MEKESSKTSVHGGTSNIRRNLSYNDISRSPSPSPSFLNYESDGGEFTTYEKEIMMASRLHQSDLLTDLHHHQDLVDRQNTVLSYMKEAAKQAQALRQENINLKMVNAELTNRLGLLIKATTEYAASFGFSGVDPGLNVDSLLNGLSRMSLADGAGVNEGNAWSGPAADGDSPSPTSVMESGGVEGSGEGTPGRILLPKSISIRSTGYLKPVQPGGNGGGKVNKVQNRSKIWDDTHKVFVRGGKKEEQPLELEVYNQGMFKTELCNKWQETGACPYGDHCQFAHGIQELRPVIRHPRYKTEVCRMVLNGDHCPYGHRCHFRHTLTDQEKVIRSINIRSLKVLNR
ncbi:unnamed protein product [Coffea canephora]|uniref:C3H1-type domain-containing protein n=1 Tax=Coffea canephora TaxID=49390 RepID=A0A068TWU9_COFCA|nr:unnamed protein product [Coffea canephora]